MDWKARIALRTLIVVMALMSTGCGYHYKCNVTFGGPPCSSASGSGGGSFSTGGDNAAGATDLFYTIASGGGSGAGNFFLQGAVLNGGKFAPLSLGLPTVPSGTYNDIAIVNKQFLYAPDTAPNGVAGTAEVSAFSINHTDGSLTAVTGSPFTTTQGSAASNAFDTQGRFLFVGDTGTGSGSGTIAAFLIDASTGALTPAPGSPFAVSGSPQTMAVDGSGKYLYASFATAGGIMGFSIDQTTGALTQLSNSPFNINPGVDMNDIKRDASGKFLIGATNSYLLTTGSPDAHLYVIAIDQTTGNLQTAVPFPTVNTVFGVTTNPVGQFVYAFTQNAAHQLAPIEGFALDTSGNLTPISGSPFSAVSGGFFGKFDQNGTQLFYPVSDNDYAVAGADSSTGVLTQTAPGTAVRHGLLDSIDEFAVTN